MTAEPEIINEPVRLRREAALLDMRFRFLARSGYSVTAAYVHTPPMPRVQWSSRISWT